MADTPRITVGSAAATALQSSIQANLALRSWAEEDDAVMAEYVLVMLANAKTAAQINAELSDLIGADYDDDFTAWLWPEAQRISSAMRGKASPPPPPAAPAPTASRQRRRSRSPAARDARGRGREDEREREERRGPDAGVAQRWRGNGQAQQQQQGEERWNRDERGPRMQDRQARPLFNAALSAAGVGRAAPQGRANGAPRNGFGGGGGDAAMHEAPSAAERSAGRTMMDDPAYAGYQAVPQPSGEDGSFPHSGGFDAAPQVPSGPKAMRIRGAGANAAAGGLFARTMAQQAPAHEQQQQQQGNTASILSRFAVPDPRAAAFTPAPGTSFSSAAASPPAPAGSSLSLLSRLDPMVPVNAPVLPPAPTAPVPASHSAPWPAQPSDTALCRYGSRCTNPLCGFSHPSPAFAKARVAREEAGGDTAMSGPGGAGAGEEEDPLVLDSTACRFGTGCTNAECARSHTSPAQAFLLDKGVLPPGDPSAQPPLLAMGGLGAPLTPTVATFAPAPKLGSVPCKFQAACTNATCPFMHYQPKASSSFSPNRSSAFSPKRTGGGSTVPCKFGSACTRANCTFAHPNGRAMDIGAKPEGDAKHVSNRLARFAAPGAAAAKDGGVERILPGQSKAEAGLTVNHGAAAGAGEKAEVKEEEGYQSSATVKSDEEVVV